ncbi:MAG: tripartite tricarboxylate transporter substrate binding protein [Betaproteobacteria bacterium]|nr:tripartite tricarboxylate transporter substrate binding protein [Betaproteobacteria bacterium]
MHLKREVLVENRGGSSGLIGAESVSKAAPDGHTLLLLSTGLVTASELPSNATATPFRLKPKLLGYVGSIATTPYLLIAAEKPKVRALADLPKRDGNVILAYPGEGTPSKHNVDVLTRTLREKWTAVPYRGLGPAINDLESGHVAAVFSTYWNAAHKLREGKLHAIAVASDSRQPALPDVPTLRERGHAGNYIEEWYGLAVAADTPPELIKALSAALERALKSETVNKALKENRVTPWSLGGEKFSEFVAGEFQKVARPQHSTGGGGGGSTCSDDSKCYCERRRECQNKPCTNCS